MVTFPMTLTDPNPVFKVIAFLKLNISKTVHLGTKLLKNKVSAFLKSNIVKMAHLKDKVTIAQ